MNRLFFVFIACFSLYSSLSHASLSSIPNTLETLPIQENGRRKPYFVFAEEALRSLSGKTSAVVHGRREKAVELITSFWLEPGQQFDQEPLLYVSSSSLKNF